MSSTSEAYNYLDRHFREVCKVMLGGEVGELKEYEKWLLELKQPLGYAKSFASGKEVTLVSPDYVPKAKFISLGEEKTLKTAPLNINEIKDIDSLLNAMAERFFYSGNLIFGNSMYVEGSSDINDSYYVYKSARIGSSKAVVCSTIIKDSSSIFGCNVGSKNEFCMRCHQFTFDARCFEGCFTISSSDCYYTYNCTGCRETLFSFGKRNSLNTIGNLALPKEKYLKLKAALLEQMRSELAAKKRLPSLFDIISAAAKEVPSPEAKKLARKIEQKANKAPVQAAWDSTCRIVLGEQLGELSRYREWLLKYNIRIRKADSALGSGEIPVPSYENFKRLPDNRYVNISEMELLGSVLSLTEKEAESISLSNASKALSRIAYATPQLVEGTNLNVYNCPIMLWSSDCEEVHGCVFAKSSAYSTWPRDSEHVFGCAFTFNSSFCIKCYNSFSIVRCFEVDSARTCNDCYFCHNIENCQNAIFCSNVKSMRYAVANVEVGREEFIRIKTLLLSRILPEIKEKGTCSLDIYSFLPKKQANK